MHYPEPESQVLVPKGSIPQNEQIIKPIIAFCNGTGGRLVLGVNNDGHIIGVDENSMIQMMEWIEKSIYEASSPPIIPKVLSQRINDKVILIIEVSSGMNKPYYRSSEGLEKGTYVRLGRSLVIHAHQYFICFGHYQRSSSSPLNSKSLFNRACERSKIRKKRHRKGNAL